MSDSLFEDQNEEVTFEGLVGEGKKYRDPDALAKAKAEADRTIKQREDELEALRNELRTRTNLEEVLEKLNKPTEPREITPMSRQEPTPPNEPEKPNLEEEVRKLLQKEKAQETRSQNLQNVRNGLKERFGADYNQTLKDIAKELSVSEEFLTDLGVSSPAGFFKLIDSVSTPDNRGPITPPRSTESPPSSTSTGRKNKAYYDEIRKKDINLYFSPRIQNELHREAMAQGAKFYQ